MSFLILSFSTDKFLLKYSCVSMCQPLLLSLLVILCVHSHHDNGTRLSSIDNSAVLVEQQKPFSHQENGTRLPSVNNSTVLVEQQKPFSRRCCLMCCIFLNNLVACSQFFFGPHNQVKHLFAVFGHHNQLKLLFAVFGHHQPKLFVC